MSLSELSHRPYPFAIMQEKMDALERLELNFKWGRYGIRVLKWHLTTFKPGQLIKFHKHSEFEFHFIPRGKGSVTLIDQTYKLGSGMFYLTGPGVVHQQTADARSGMDELCLHVDITPLPGNLLSEEWGAEWENRESEACIQALNGFPLRPFMDQHDAMASFLQAYMAWRSGELGAYTTIRQSLIQILIRAAKATVDPNGQQLLPARDIQAHRFEMALQYMHANYASPLTLQEVADRIQISVRQLQRIFNKFGIESFSSYLEAFRLQRICEDLVETSNTVEAIAISHGFMNSNYLFQVFKRQKGLTPLAYRLKHTRKTDERPNPQP
ncbi:AraC family transcriptional regulator [Paenibacillus sp. MMS18-CY102]|uniref:AraC family transcriptional regulator n=1 Tax=Paenibacillus sp. MMS18-CY102 TaxID=2682849 RepID=UPI001365F216|nr:AraC family transcriptional regulator [Paenibacillus sp. MMS18-CY102]MWC30974.1 helix-turn-helix domain-containing protein [Paenibacillus sp. MMS18-CY102]